MKFKKMFAIIASSKIHNQVREMIFWSYIPKIPLNLMERGCFNGKN